MIVAKGKWQKVAVSGFNFSEKDFDGLVSIEELYDYELEALPRQEEVKTQCKLSKKQKRKRVANKDRKTEEVENAGARLQTKVRKRRRKGISGWCEAEESSESKRSRVDGMEKWDGLDVPHSVLVALHELGFSQPTPIQLHALPAAIRDRRDTVGAAETGSGKTLAFGIPLVHHILRMQSERSEIESEDKPWYALVLTPTRELALQVKRHLSAVAKHTGIKIVAVVGGMSVLKQERLLKRQPEIVVATPGRLWELLDMGDPHLSKIEDVQLVVVDEADRMVEHGHFAELVNILQKLPQPRERYESVSNVKKKQRRGSRCLSKRSESLTDADYKPTVERQTFVFSATLSLPKSEKQRWTQKKDGCSFGDLMEKVGLRSNPCIIDLTQQHVTAETLTETRITCTEEEKDVYLYYFLCHHPGRTLVFTNTVDCIRRLRSLLSILQANPLPLHAGMQQRQRLKNLERFSSNPTGLLVSSDVAARGLDIFNVDHVIHYQVPQNADLYVHRSGRTARASTEGISVMLVGPKDSANYKRICKRLNRNEDLKLFPVDVSCWMELKARVGLARRIDKEEHRVSQAKSKTDWFLKTAKAMDIELDDDMLPDDSEMNDSKRSEEKIRGMKRELSAMLKKPVMPSGHSMRFPTASTRLVTIGLHGKESTDQSALNTVKHS